MRRYDELFRLYPSYSESGVAMVESADCYRRLSQVLAARRLLERARSDRRVRSAAERQIQLLDQVEASRAGRRAPSTAAEAAPSSGY